MANCSVAEQMVTGLAGEQAFQAAMQKSINATVKKTVLTKKNCPSRRLSIDSRRLSGQAGVKAEFTITIVKGKTLTKPTATVFQQNLKNELLNKNISTAGIKVNTFSDPVQTGGQDGGKTEDPTVSAAVVAPATFSFMAIWLMM